MQKTVLIFLLALAPALFAMPAQAVDGFKDATILIVRHAEKPATKAEGPGLTPAAGGCGPGFSGEVRGGGANAAGAGVRRPGAAVGPRRGWSSRRCRSRSGRFSNRSPHSAQVGVSVLVMSSSFGPIKPGRGAGWVAWPW